MVAYLNKKKGVTQKSFCKNSDYFQSIIPVIFNSKILIFLASTPILSEN